MGSGAGVKVSQLLASGNTNPKLAYHNSNSSNEVESNKSGAVTASDKDWMSSGFGSSSSGFYKSGGTNRPGPGAYNQPPATMERPMTASGMNNKTRELENQLREEQRSKKRLVDEVESLKKELHKQSFSQFTSNSSEVSVTAGRLPAVAGVREISMEDLEFGEQIGQGGFSVIHKGFLNGTPVAIKKIFDPSITDDLLAEIQNEIVM